VCCWWRCCSPACPDTPRPGLTAGLFLLGLGWSCSVVAGSTLIAQSVEVADRPGVQGAADLTMNLAGALAGGASGVALGAVGYGGLNAGAAVLVVPVVLVCLWPGPRGSVACMADDAARSDQIIETLTDCFAPLVEADPAAFRRKFRTMAADPYAFYRGSACLFFRDVAEREDPWADERTSRVWIQGDLHAENFGTYMDAAGILVFDVNDFDEAYLGHFTWDLQRLAASMALKGWTKALPDDRIRELIETYARAYVEQVHHFVDSDRDHEWALRLDTSTGRCRTRCSTRR
jgi:hypothetical protein